MIRPVTKYNETRRADKSGGWAVTLFSICQQLTLQVVYGHF